MKKQMLAVSVLVIVFSSTSGAAQPSGVRQSLPYVIVTDAGDRDSRDPYAATVAELATLRNATVILDLNDTSFEDVFGRLRALKPRYVAFVLHPEKIESNFVGAVFQEISQFDDDPFLDCACGYITGASADDAVALVRNTAAAELRSDRVPRKFVAIAHTFAQNDLAPFAAQQADHYQRYGYATAQINPIDDSAAWKSSAEQELRKLDGASLVFLAGHGMGDMSCAIPGDAFGRHSLDFAIVINGTCHSAVTGIRHDSVDRWWTVKTSGIDPEKSVCLNLVKAGAVGQIASTASSSWSNVATSIHKFFDEGRSMGEALQEALNQKILAAGIKEMRIIPFEDGRRSPQALSGAANPGGIQSLSRVILIGDPAYRPFPHRMPRRSPMRRPERAISLLPKDKAVRQLIEEMSQPEAPRFKALNDIIEIGEPAVPLLVEEMKTSDNWQIPKALGEIGDERAVVPLIEKLADCSRPDVVAEALSRITGKDFGHDADVWRAWWQGRGDQVGGHGDAID